MSLICCIFLFSFCLYVIRYYKKLVYFIDVSQSVENDHPRAMEFLDNDISHVTSFFSKLCATAPDEVIKNYVIGKMDESELLSNLNISIKVATNEAKVDDKWDLSKIPAALLAMLPKLENQVKLEQKVDDLFKENTNQIVRRMYVPKNQMNVEDISDDSEDDSDEEDDLEISDESKVDEIAVNVEDVLNLESTSESEIEDEENSSGDDEEKDPASIVELSKMTKEQKKEHKAKVKAENREKRKTKIPKKIKKKKHSKGKGKK